MRPANLSRDRRSPGAGRGKSCYGAEPISPWRPRRACRPRDATTPDCFSRSLRTDWTSRSNRRRFCLTVRSTRLRRWRSSRSNLRAGAADLALEAVARGGAAALVALELALEADDRVAVLGGQTLDGRDQVVAGQEAGADRHQHGALGDLLGLLDGRLAAASASLVLVELVRRVVPAVARGGCGRSTCGSRRRSTCGPVSRRVEPCRWLVRRGGRDFSRSSVVDRTCACIPSLPGYWVPGASQSSASTSLLPRLAIRVHSRESRENSADALRPSGDASIAYQVVGDGPCDLVVIPGPASHLELMWEEPGTAHCFERMA